MFSKHVESMSRPFETVKYTLSVLGITGLRVGCAPTAAQRQYQAMATGNQAAMQDHRACISAIYDSPEFAPLRRAPPRTVGSA
jgi:hypothetical protein